MAHRTKSFFDQENSSKARPVHYNRHPQSRQPLSEAPANIPPKPAIPPTKQTKSKLKAFQFVPDGVNAPSVETVDDKLATIRNDEIATKEKDSASVHERAAWPDTDTPQLRHANTFPCTPNTRLPLEDLIGDCNVAKQALPMHESPEEHIGWMPNSSSQMLTPNRKRKRARSSSPSCPTTSSQQRQATRLASGLSSAEKVTPEMDPAADLWRKYAGGRPTESLEALAKIAFEGSPRPLETPIRSGGFRRWVSTGNDWPISKNKRLCPSTRANINTWQDQTAMSGKSKVAAMVQKIQESLSSQTLEKARQPDEAPLADAPSSSSPLPEVKSEREDVVSGFSPLQNRQANIRPRSRSPDIKETSCRPQLPAISVTRRHDHDRSDIIFPGARQDLLDPDLPGSIALHFQNKVPMPAYKRPTVTRTKSEPKVPAAIELPNLAPIGESVDEFGDEFGDEFDLTADDLDEIMAEAVMPSKQSQAVSISDSVPRPGDTAITHDPVLHSTIFPYDDDDDDEFGSNDINEDDFNQAYICATQGRRISPHKRQVRLSRSLRKPRDSTKSPSPKRSTSNARTSPDLQRYIVRQVQDGSYTDGRGHCQPERTLLAAEHSDTTKLTAITLRQSWASTAIAPDDIIHIADVVGAISAVDERSTEALPPGQVLISDHLSSPFLVVHPDHLLSATTVADSFDCARKAVLQNIIKATGETSKAMVYGNILHEVFQHALVSNCWDAGFLGDLVKRCVNAHAEGLWELGMRDETLAVEEVTAKIAELGAWAHAFVRIEPAESSLVEDQQGERVRMSISKVIAIEEHIWSPKFGLKGNIDVTIEATLLAASANDDNGNPNQNSRTHMILPLEVKTGKTTQSAAHRAQTALYTLLLSDRYQTGIRQGLLYYLESGSMSRITPPLVEMRQMVQMRNRVATYIFNAKHPLSSREQVTDLQHNGEARAAVAPSSQVQDGSNLPNLLRNPFKCTKCYAQASCFTYHALLEGGTAESAGMVDDKKKNHSLVWREAVGHLVAAMASSTVGPEAKQYERRRTETLRQFFSKWDRLLTFEEGDQLRFRKELWTMSSMEREKVGRCFGNLVLRRDSQATAASALSKGDVINAALESISSDGGSRINRFAYTFIRNSQPDVQGHEERRQRPFTEGSQLVVGEPVVVSSEQGQWALANGYVTAVSRKEISIAVDRELGDSRQRLPGFDPQNQQSLRGIMTVGETITMKKDESTREEIVYRLDKDEFSNGLALVRNNLLMLMSAHPAHTKLRDVVVHSVEPSFSTSTTHKYAQRQAGTVPIPDQMNLDQRRAVSKVLSANDYAIILGMPGTGKTTTIAQIIRALRDQGKSILLTSFTHTAVDNILLKLKSSDVLSREKKDVLRLGTLAKVNPQVREFCLLAAASSPRTTIDEVEAAYMETPIVAATCLGTTNHPLFRRRMFDVCIVDEASQITLPTILGPLLHARKFVLVGDHFQLPPLVQNPLALKGGLDESLFRMLCEKEGGQEATVELGCQYRMCEDIMRLSNQLIYSGRLRCGNEAVAKRTLLLPTEKAGLKWLHDQCTPSAGQCCSSKCWLREASQPEQKVVLIDTDTLGDDAAKEVLDGSTKNLTNPAEARLSLELVMALLAQGVDGKDIGIITPYRSQLGLLRHMVRLATRNGISQPLPGATESGLTSIEVDTPDRFQGRDKEVMILSMVRSNSRGEVGELLRDARRVNVALTRARSKMIVIGSRSTLEKGSELLQEMIAIVDGVSASGQGMRLLQVPNNALAQHGLLDLMASQSQALALAEATSSPGKQSSASTPIRERRISESQTKQSSLKKKILDSSQLECNSQQSPSKRRGSPLKPRSPNAGYTAARLDSQKPLRSIGGNSLSVSLQKGPKIISGRASSHLSGRMRKMKEAVALEIWEDITTEEIDAL